MKIIIFVEAFLESLYTGEISFHDRLLICIGRHSHQAPEMNMRVIVSGRQDKFNLFFSKTALGLLGTKVELEKNVYDLVMLTPPLLNRIQKALGINGFHKRSIRQDQL